ncbi:hypothetical protein BRC78_03525, partial [Halobacteriales archaeon QH_8_68_33]
MSDQDAQAQAGTVEGQGPVEIDEELARHLGNKREELFEKFEIRDEFPQEVLDEAETRTEDVGSEIQGEVDERRDLRDMTTWTTDPIDAQDFDDAISIERREDEYVLRVHIADVTHYVTPDTAMWEEARERANTVYLLVGQVLRVEVHLDGVSQAVLVGDQRADRLGEDGREHVD